MSDRKLYRGTFNYSREILEEWCRADSEAQAWRLLTARVAMQKDVTAYDARMRFPVGKNNHIIEEVKGERKEKEASSNS